MFSYAVLFHLDSWIVALVHLAYVQLSCNNCMLCLRMHVHFISYARASTLIYIFNGLVRSKIQKRRVSRIWNFACGQIFLSFFDIYRQQCRSWFDLYFVFKLQNAFQTSFFLILDHARIHCVCVFVFVIKVNWSR